MAAPLIVIETHPDTYGEVWNTCFSFTQHSVICRYISKYSFYSSFKGPFETNAMLFYTISTWHNKKPAKGIFSVLCRHTKMMKITNKSLRTYLIGGVPKVWDWI